MKKLKLTLIILICVLIMMIGFLGIFVKHNNSYKNILPEFKLASDIIGTTTLEFEIDGSNDTIYLDKDGKTVDSSEVTEENKDEYEKKETPVNSQEVLTQENYKEVVKIMKKRLNFLKADQYNIDLDPNTGKILLTFEDEYSDDIKSILPMQGKLQFIDSNTNDVVFDYINFNSVDTSYAAKDDGSYVVYLNLKLNSEGIQKYNEIEKYKNGSTEENKNTLKVMFDGDEISKVEYENILLTGKTLRITTNDNVKNNSTIQSAMNTNTVVAKLATMGKMPVVYKINAEEYVNSNVSQKEINYVVISIITVCAVLAIYFIAQYKQNGIVATIAFFTQISLFLILIKLTGVQVSLNGIAGILALIVLNTILIKNILKEVNNLDKTFSENIKKAYLNSIDTLVVAIIIFAVFSFSKMTVINSMGLLFFWGWLIVVLGNLLVTIPMLSISNKK